MGELIRPIGTDTQTKNAVKTKFRMYLNNLFNVLIQTKL